MSFYFHKTPPPAELTLAWQCERWRTLPEGGGLYNQDFRTMSLMTSLSNVYHAVSRIHELGKNIHKLTDAERRILKILMDEGLMFHA